MDPTNGLHPSKRQRVMAYVAPSPNKQNLSTLLASFGASRSPMSARHMEIEARLRETKPISYAESESEVSNAFASPQSSFAAADSPSSTTTAQPLQVDSDSEEDSEGEIITVAGRQQQMPSMLATRELPARSTRSRVSYASPKRVLKSRKGKTGGGAKFALRSDTMPSTSKGKGKGRPQHAAMKLDTARNRIRQEIADTTKPKREAFLLAHKDMFLPILPQNNYIDKLQRLRDMSGGDQTAYVAHKMLHKQPAGVKAVMKPYQIEGLSYLVHMYNNGMSCILADEMGLGKTLQTLALFQWLKINKPISKSTEARPYLVVCPLSVLDSWVREATKWTPDLSVIRMHGAKTERDRIKQEIMGFVDRYGQQTAKAKAKSKPRVTKSSAGHAVIDLDSEDDEDDGEMPVDIVVTTYETFASEQNWFKRAFVWRYVVLDEGHKIKNEKSDISSSLQSLSAEHRLLLTGTPLQNNLQELWALLHWLYPEVFTDDTAVSFKKAFDLTKGTASTSFMDNARQLLELIMLRRMKTSAGVNLNLPPKEDILLFVPLTPMQRFWYQRLLTKADNGLLEEVFRGAKTKEENAIKGEAHDDTVLTINEGDSTMAGAAPEDGLDVWAESREIMAKAVEEQTTDSKGNDWKKLMMLIMQLRKTCSHPYLIPGAWPEGMYDGDHIRTASGKFIVLDKLLDEIVVKQRKKIIIFSGFTKTLDLTEKLLELKGANSHDAPFRYVRFDGSTQRARRNFTIRLFNDMKSDFNVMLISTRAGGLGINLTSATEVVFLDEDWNPQITLQAEARAHRIGQTKKVTVYKLCTQGTVEEQMMGRIRKKLYLSAKITESMRNLHSAESQSKKRKRGPSAGDAFEEDAPQLRTSELKTLLRRGAQTLSAPQVDVTEMLSWDWATTLEKCKDRPQDALVNTSALNPAKPEDITEEQWLNNIEKVECAVFEGRTLQRKLDAKVAEPVDLTRADRRLGKNTTVMQAGFAISKQSLLCGDWEAVPTLSGKGNLSLAEPVREKKAPVVNQVHCQTCWTDDGTLTNCSGCPRAYHAKCLPPAFHAKLKSRIGNFYCPQHECVSCEKKTADAGGLIYRCRWCANGFCEDCLDWDTAKLVGEQLPELAMLGHETIGGWYVECQDCVGRWVGGDKDDEKRFAAEKERVEEDYRAWAEEQGFGADGEDVKTPTTISEAVTPVERLVMPAAKKLKKGGLGSRLSGLLEPMV
ncbi:hypothetical protein LTR95_002284 [Oleoguttula sp. CCFEE 5521]